MIELIHIRRRSRLLSEVEENAPLVVRRWGKVAFQDRYYVAEEKQVKQYEERHQSDEHEEVCARSPPVDTHAPAPAQDVEQGASEEDAFKDDDEPRDRHVLLPPLGEAARQPSQTGTNDAR
jgi:hypothetical protein